MVEGAVPPRIRVGGGWCLAAAEQWVPTYLQPALIGKMMSERPEVVADGCPRSFDGLAAPLVLKV